MRRTLLGLGLLAAGAVLFLSGRRRTRRLDMHSTDEGFGAPKGDAVVGLAGQRLELDAEPLLIVHGAHDDVRVAAGDGAQVIATATGDAAELTHVLRAERGDGTLVLHVHPRCSVEVTVPRGTAVRLQVAKSRSTIEGVDNIDVFSAKGRTSLHDVAGRVRIRSAMEEIDVDLSPQRETREVSVMMAKGKFSLTVPVARGGVYRVDAAKTRFSAPPSVEGGIPVRVRAAKSDVLIRAA